MRRHLGLAALVATASSCVPNALRPLSIHPSISLPVVEPIVGVAQKSNHVYVATANEVEIFRETTLVAHISSPPTTKWTSIAVVWRGHDDESVAATTSDGNLWRIGVDGRLENMCDIFPVQNVQSISSAANTTILQTASSTSVVQGANLMTFPVWGTMAVANNRLARVTDSAVEVWDLERVARTVFSIAGVRAIGFDAAGLLAVLTNRAIFVQSPDMSMRPIALRNARTFAITDNAWVLIGERLYVVDHAALREVHIESADRIRTLFAAGHTLWIQTPGRLLAVAPMRRPSRVARAWSDSVSPIFARSCSKCHLPNATGVLDLSNAGAWSSHRDEIRVRVLEERSMPPAGHMLTDEERATVGRWLELEAH